jgi:hypothetical protein
MKRKNLAVMLFLTVAVVMTGIVFLVPVTAADLDGSTWETSFDPITFSQSGSAVTGTYTPPIGSSSLNGEYSRPLT